MPFRLTTITFQKILKSTLLIVLLKAGKLVKLTEMGRLFHALMTLLAKKFILTVQSLRGLYSLYKLYKHINVYGIRRCQADSTTR